MAHEDDDANRLTPFISWLTSALVITLVGSVASLIAGRWILGLVLAVAVAFDVCALRYFRGRRRELRSQRA